MASRQVASRNCSYTAELQKWEHKTVKETEAKLILLKQPWDQKEVKVCLVCMCRGSEMFIEMLAMTHLYF